MATTRLTFRNTNPDQLDRMVRVATPSGWLVLAILGATVLGGLVWASVSTAPVKVRSTGVLQGSGGVLLVSAPNSAPVAELDVRVGSRVRQGDIVARLSEPVLDARADTVAARLAGLAQERSRLSAFQAREREVRERADAQRRQGLERTLEQLRQREATLVQTLANQRDLLARGFATRDRLQAAENDLDQARRAAIDARNSLNALLVEADERGVRAERELMDLDARLNQARQEQAEVAAERAARTEVRAPAAGRVIELSVAAGDRVPAGAALMRLVPEEADAPETGAGGLEAVLYVPPADGKKVRPGMAVQVVPSTVRVERDGFIQGEVVAVSEIPATREAIQRTLKNDTFVAKLTADGPPFEVRVALRPDPNTVSGFAWSSDLGRTRAVESGTVVDGLVVVERVRLMTLVFPAFDSVLHALGLEP
ncbi:NHLP bacteriocin system secretion protein [Azospirillum sp. SYSU D00513]|uniref:NHLP bacteriocin system secretion protein n=1 Tax=Azospirillum sp. SYSU D00513 TaxID=2812561 RepID=UPI001A9607A5|nr:NHLP bacteriocin system secretion protein [Azospirillum sp. SYSU D00513]